MSAASTSLTVIAVPDWPAPKGYANGVVTEGRTLYVAGQIGWNERQEIASDDLAEQLAQALDNVLAVARAAGAAPSDLAKMTVYVTDLEAYRGSLREIGRAWRARFEKHFPAMALVGVAGLVERRAKVEIEATFSLGRGAWGGSPACPGEPPIVSGAGE